MKLALSLAAAAAALALAAPSIADVAKKDTSYYTPAAYAEAEGDIVVRPYGIVRERTGRRTSIGGREEILSMSRVVTTAGLDLRYDAHVDELYRRISHTAAQICDELERASFGASMTSDRECVRDAVRDARYQADTLVARARY